MLAMQFMKLETPVGGQGSEEKKENRMDKAGRSYKELVTCRWLWYNLCICVGIMFLRFSPIVFDNCNMAIRWSVLSGMDDKSPVGVTGLYLM